MIISCVSCSVGFEVGDIALGTEIKCPECGEIFVYTTGLDELEMDLLGQRDSSAAEKSADPDPFKDDVDLGITDPDINKSGEDEAVRREQELRKKEEIQREEELRKKEEVQREEELRKKEEVQREEELRKKEEVQREEELQKKEDVQKKEASKPSASEDYLDELLEEVSRDDTSSDEELTIEHTGQEQRIEQAKMPPKEPPRQAPEKPHQDEPQQKQARPAEQTGGLEISSAPRFENDVVSASSRSAGSSAKKDSETRSEEKEPAEVQTGKPSSKKRPRYYGFIRLLGAAALGMILLLGSSFLLNRYDIYPNNLYESFKFKVVGFIDDTTPLSVRKVKVTGSGGKWVSSRYGQVYMVSGEVANNSDDLVSFIKLKVTYASEGSVIHMQEVWAGNTLSDWEVKNKSWKEIKAKMMNKAGQISFGKKVDAVNGMNINISPDEKIPFVSVYRPPDGDKILGLKFGIEINSYESSSR